MLRSRIAERLTLILVLCAPFAARAAGEGRLECAVTENGKSASGTVLVLDGQTEITRGSCGKPMALPAGDHLAVVTLDGALDAPEQRRPISVVPEQVTKLSVDFATGLLEVRITSQGHDTAGMALIRKDGKQIGTLGSGVAAHLSAGTYEVIARYRNKEQKFPAVAIAAGQHAVLDAAFQ